MLYVNRYKIEKMYKDSSAKYYQNNKEKLQKRLLRDIKFFLKMKRKIKRQYGCEQYKTVPEDEKQKLAEYRKKYYKTKKITYYNYKKLFLLRKSQNILKSNDEECIKAKYGDVF